MTFYEDIQATHGEVGEGRLEDALRTFPPKEKQLIQTLIVKFSKNKRGSHSRKIDSGVYEID